MASFARLLRTTRGPWGNMRVSFRIYKRSVRKACETSGVYCSLCAVLSETYSSVGTCFCFVSFFFFFHQERQEAPCLAMVMDTDLVACVPFPLRWCN